ncbi:unnamed protein product [Pocillopora meandrina]|uniref:Uncharacterized protein n=1 Tax=Pocillopora meandrina TaxID=46732 RepID=A0AAU9X6X0_9CNID|nr:unnamed protein product [Pocillopora meandrina]
MVAPSLAIPPEAPNSEAPNSRHTILMPVQGKSMKSISLQLISNQKYMPKLSTAFHKIQKARPYGKIKNMHLTHSKATSFTNENS